MVSGLTHLQLFAKVILKPNMFLFFPVLESFQVRVLKHVFGKALKPFFGDPRWKFMEIPGLGALHPPVSLIASHLCYTYHRLPSKLPTGSSIQQINLPSPWLYIYIHYILYKTISNKNMIRSFRLSPSTRP